MARPHYDAALKKLRSRLPETPGRVDADHGWLTPVKAHSDVVAVDALIQQGVVDKEFVADVLAVDFTNPVFSKTRCGLFEIGPRQGRSGFCRALSGCASPAPSLPGVSELLASLSDPARNAAFHEKQAVAFLASCRQRAADPDAVLEWSGLLVQRRVEVSASEISQNSHKGIFWRIRSVFIVFPITQPKAVAGRLALTPACRVQ